MQNLLQNDGHNDLLLELERVARLVLVEASKLEQIMLQQRAKIQWLKGGDQCTRIFFQKELLGGQRHKQYLNIDYLRPWTRHVISAEEGAALIRPIHRDEIKETIFDIDEDKVLGSDSFSCGFYEAAWPMIGDEVISLSHSGFVPGRLLSDNVLLAQELIHSLESHRPDANVVFKLDMAKAYDRVSWEFVYQVLQRKGFPQRWIGLVANAISHCWFSVLVNGEHAGFFDSTRGLRQGDPLSPALFVLAADYLSRGLEQLFAAHPTMFYQAPSLIRVSHLAYADDLMIFTTTCRQNMELLRDFLRAYERVSGQLINGSKSSFICGRQASSLQTQAV
ncbi:UNVERIFIED_CONTAM: hypothetical protein Sradi_7124100 [Sesamum radiatum]|uniref:Reverse transcriptase domain-containing protein n=1 Tax=Sesamum radiatum TaxID=300843 RepID=A0AAW2IZH8_SESRA